jgi:methylglutamate dehydrogenase subunit D
VADIEALAPLAPRSPFAGLIRPGLHGRPGSSALVIEDVSRRGIASLVLARPQPFGVVRRGRAMHVTTQPDQTLVVADPGEILDLKALDGAVTDLTGSRAILRVSGPWREALSALLPIDLHPNVFGPGAAAATYAAHLSTLVWHDEASDAVEVAVYRSFAGALLHAVETSAAPLGYRIG